MRRRAFVRQAAGMTALAVLGGCSELVGTAPQPPKIRRIGYLSGNSTVTSSRGIDVVRQTLSELGYVEGRDFVIEIRISDGLIDPLPAMAAELVAQPVDVLVAEAAPAALAAQQATATIPVVFLLVPDPVELGLVTSLARPGGNVTGVPSNSTALSGKKLELLKDAIPHVARVAGLWRSNNPGQVLALEETRAAARALGLEIEAFGVPLGSPGELDKQLEIIAKGHFDALLVMPQFTVAINGKIVDFAGRIGLPQMYSNLEFVRAGGLMALAPDYFVLSQRTAGLVDRILKGARPADLPVEQPTQFEFVVNLAMARRIGVTIPDSVLRQATEVIR